VDGGQQRRHLWHASVEDLRRRPWYGDRRRAGQRFNENNRKDLTAEDVRFTSKGKVVYAFVMGCRRRKRSSSPWEQRRRYEGGQRSDARFQGQAAMDAGADGLKVQMPAAKPCDHVIALKVTSA